MAANGSLFNDCHPLTAAVSYAQAGLPTFFLSEGEKRPIPGSHGCKDATCDTDKLAASYEANSNGNTKLLNVGIATGTVEGLEHNRIIVIDDDAPKYGETSFIDEWEAETGKTFNRDTVTVKTGNGGLQYVFHDPEGLISKSGARSSRHIDVRADGGYVCAPTSRLANGGVYQFVEGHGPDEIEFALIDEDLADFYLAWFDLPTGKKAPRTQSRPQKASSTVYEVGSYVWEGDIENGGRNDAAVRLLGCLIGWQLSDNTIAKVMEAWNENYCIPALPSEELDFTVQHAIEAYGGDRDTSWVSKDTKADLITMVIYRAFRKEFPSDFVYILATAFNEFMLDGHFFDEDVAKHINWYIKRFSVDADMLEL